MANSNKKNPFIFKVGNYQYKSYFGQIHTTYERLAKKSNTSRATMGRFLKEFEEKGFIKRENKGNCVLIEFSDYNQFIRMGY